MLRLWQCCHLAGRTAVVLKENMAWFHWGFRVLQYWNISFLSLHFGSRLISCGNAFCFFMVSMNSFLSVVLKTASNSISSSIHQCSGRKCTLIHFMEISFCVHSFWRKLDVHILTIHPSYLDKCQACTTVMYVDFNFTRTDAATMTE